MNLLTGSDFCITPDFLSCNLFDQSITFDFVEVEDSNPLIVEMSYCFGTTGLVNAPGYWDEQLNWHNENVNPQRYIIKDFITEIKQQNGKA